MTSLAQVAGAFHDSLGDGPGRLDHQGVVGLSRDRVGHSGRHSAIAAQTSFATPSTRRVDEPLQVKCQSDF